MCLNLFFCSFFSGRFVRHSQPMKSDIGKMGQMINLNITLEQLSRFLKIICTFPTCLTALKEMFFS